MSASKKSSPCSVDAFDQERPRLVDCRLGDAERLAGDADPARVERAHRDRETLALLAQPVRSGHLRRSPSTSSPVGEPFKPIFLNTWPTLTPGASAGTRKAVMPAALLGLAGAGKHDVEAGATDVGDEDLCAVEDVARRRCAERSS